MTLTFTGMGGIALAADAWGPEGASPVLLIGGLGQTRHGWSRAAERIGRAGWRAIAMDLRGHGESGWSPDGGYDYDQTSGDVIAVARALGRPVALIGASLGGKIALTAAGYGGPDIARAPVMVDTVPRTDPAGVAERWRRYCARRPRDSDRSTKLPPSWRGFAGPNPVPASGCGDICGAIPQGAGIGIGIRHG